MGLFSNVLFSQKFPSIFVGIQHSCAVFENGTLKCWGYNQDGQLGLGDSSPRGASPSTMGELLPTVDLGKEVKVEKVALGYSHTCALLRDKTIKCWGSNRYGELGIPGAFIGTKPEQMGDNLARVDLGGKKAIDVSLGAHVSCALLEDHSSRCWGHSALMNAYEFQEKGIEELAAGPFIGCVIFQDRTIRCQGNNLFGNVGMGWADSENPNRVNLGKNAKVKQLALGNSHSCALLMDGRVKCWGYNGDGRLGLGHREPVGHQSDQMGDRLKAIDLGTGVKPVAITAGEFHTCALMEDHQIKCWGMNNFGSLGLGDMIPRGSFSNEMGTGLPYVDLGLPVHQLSSGAGYHTCAYLSNQAWKCWGLNTNGQLGVGDTISRGGSPADMGSNLDYLDLGP